MKNVSKFTITKDLLKSCKSARRLYEEHLQSKKVESVKKSLSTEISSIKEKLCSELKQGQMWRKILLSIPKKLIQRPRQRSPPLFPLRRQSCLRVLYILRNSWPYCRPEKSIFPSVGLLISRFNRKISSSRSECRKPHAEIPFGWVLVGL